MSNRRMLRILRDNHIIPRDVTEALHRGEISRLQFCILVTWHALAERDTGIVQAWRAETLQREMGGDAPSLETIRRETKRLILMGWADWTYRQGIKTPYMVLLRNYVAQRCDCQPECQGDCEEILLRHGIVKTWAEGSDSHECDDESEEVDDGDCDSEKGMTANAHKDTKPFAAQTPQPSVSATACGDAAAARPNPSGQERMARTAVLEVCGRIHEDETVAEMGVIPPEHVVARLLKTYGADEIVQAVNEYTSKWASGSSKELREFFTSGDGSKVEAVLLARRLRRASAERVAAASQGKS